MQSIVYNKDCMIDLKTYSNGFFDIAIVDPPYGINAPNLKMGSHNGRISTAERLKGRLNSGGGALKNRLLNKSNFDWDNNTPDQQYFNEIKRVSKNQIIFGYNYFNLPPSRCIICWDKCQPWPNFSQFELAWTSFDKPAKMYKISNTGGNNNEKKIHPTQKPLKLYLKIYQEFTKPGFKILDTHLGSGSNRIAADMANCNFVGYEINQMYFEDQERRFNQYKKQLSLFE